MTGRGTEFMAHILATIKFRRTEDGGRETPLPSGRIGCILEVSGQDFSCWLLNAKGLAVAPGSTRQLEVIIAAPELAMPLLKEGSSFVLKDYRELATGVVDRVVA